MELFLVPQISVSLLANCKSDPKPLTMSSTSRLSLPGTYHSGLKIHWQAGKHVHITSLTETMPQVLSVSELHGSHSACPVTGGEKVPARTLKQALISPGTHHTSPHYLSNPLTRTQAPLFSQQPSFIHCVDEMSFSDFGEIDCLRFCLSETM